MDLVVLDENDANVKILSEWISQSASMTSKSDDELRFDKNDTNFKSEKEKKDVGVRVPPSRLD
jgi:hypothetical protein